MKVKKLNNTMYTLEEFIKESKEVMKALKEAKKHDTDFIGDTGLYISDADNAIKWYHKRLMKVAKTRV